MFDIAVVATIEFQKRGLPHAHILLWLDSSCKFTDANQIDEVISAEIPDPDTDPELYEVVKTCMIHGPCGAARKSSPCMIDSKCSKHFPKGFCDRTTFDDEGYCKYRRRDNGITVEKNGVHLDNRYVVPYNRYLLLRHRAHINVEHCNQARSIKYLFKYVNKGNDRVSATLCENKNGVDETKSYYECRYISPCDGIWRLFGFQMMIREPAVERLPFHLPNEQSIIFDDNDPIDMVANRSETLTNKFLAWFKANVKYKDAKNLTYQEFPTKFVYHDKDRCWEPRKQGFALGRLYFVPTSAGELHYLRMLLNVKKGPISFKELRTVDGVTYGTFKEACYVLGFLHDDKEYIDALTEASFWGTGLYLRRLFTNMLITNSISRILHVWEQTWRYLADDIILFQRHLMHDPGLFFNIFNVPMLFFC